ncbi:hypothetical protein EI94DRAFT_1805940 [Lactarius quietus]|nr:hypothetical protein EI94DRAFT_1805940 [Lactarius quietus]
MANPPPKPILKEQTANPNVKLWQEDDYKREARAKKKGETDGNMAQDLNNPNLLKMDPKSDTNNDEESSPLDNNNNNTPYLGDIDGVSDQPACESHDYSDLYMEDPFAPQPTPLQQIGTSDQDQTNANGLPMTPPDAPLPPPSPQSGHSAPPSDVLTPHNSTTDTSQANSNTLPTTHLDALLPPPTPPSGSKAPPSNLGQSTHQHPIPNGIHSPIPPIASPL